jgi:hypothetical protein
MQIISSGNTFEIFDDTLKTYDKFPAQSYVVRFSKFKGFYLEKYVDMEINEDKIYGVHNEKVNKVINSFNNFNRSLGVILSGDKGIGKSLFAKLLANKAIENNIPLIVVDTFIPGIASYLESIDQEVMVLFDEFDKTFADVKAEDGQASPQTNLLTLFDGISGGKKLFVITCNDMNKLSDYIINRPGRFHYHFRFEYPNMQEVREYLTDKLDKKYYGEIDSVVAFSRRINLNYDCLRAIAFELNNGLSFKDAIADLNIINYNNYTRYNLTLHYKNGLNAFVKNYGMSLYDEDDVDLWFEDSNGYDFVRVEFDTNDAVFDVNRGLYVIHPENIKVKYDTDEDESVVKLVNCAKESEIECLAISRVSSKNIHYLV